MHQPRKEDATQIQSSIVSDSGNCVSFHKNRHGFPLQGKNLGGGSVSVNSGCGWGS